MKIESLAFVISIKV